MPNLTPRESRTIGALLGVHAGDALGATLEFRTYTWIRTAHPTGLRSIVGGGLLHWPPGHATDDTDLTRAVLLAYRDLRRAQPSPSPSPADSSASPSVVTRAADYFVAWYDGAWPSRRPGSRPIDIGGATADGIRKYKRKRDPRTSGAGTGSAGNGSLMRCIPTALFQPDPSLLVQESLAISAVTHDDPRCTVACAAYNAIVAGLVEGDSPGSAVRAGVAVAMELEEGDGEGMVTAAIEQAKRLSVAETARDGAPKDVKGNFSGYVLDSLILAVAAVLDPRSFEDVVVDVVRIGNDTDTNGAIAGGLLGARDGFEAIPAEWRSKLQFAQEFEDTALELLR